MSDSGGEYYYEDDEAPAGLEEEESYNNYGGGAKSNTVMPSLYSSSQPKDSIWQSHQSKDNTLTSDNLGKNTFVVAGQNENATKNGKSFSGGDVTSPSAKQSQVELEVAKRLLQSQITLTVERYDAHISALVDGYFSGVKERRMLFLASRAIAAPLVPFGGGGAEERSATLRFERMLIAGTKAMEVELNAFRKNCFEIQAEWQKEFLKVCHATHEKEMRRKDDFLNLQAICRKEVGATCSKMKAVFASKAVELEELADMRRAVEILKEEAAATREALQEARRIGAEDRTRHFREREEMLSDFSSTLQTERSKFADKIRELNHTMEEERSAHLSEISAAAQRHARAMAELQAQLSDARESNTHYVSEASCARGETIAEKKAFVEERIVMQRYIRELEAALIEVGGRPDLVPSSRAAAVYLASAAARRDKISGGGGASGASLVASSSIAAAAAAGHNSLVAAALDAASVSSRNMSHSRNYGSSSGVEVQQQQAIDFVDAMLAGRGVRSRSPNSYQDPSSAPHHGNSTSNAYDLVTSPLLVGAGTAAGHGRERFDRAGRGVVAASPFAKDHSATITDVATKSSFLQQLRSPSAERGGGHPHQSFFRINDYGNPNQRSRSASPNQQQQQQSLFGNSSGSYGHHVAPYRQPSFASPLAGDAERYSSRGAMARSLASPTAGSSYFSSRR